MLFTVETILLLGTADFENGSESSFLSLKSSLRFNSLQILNQEGNKKVSVSKLLLIKGRVGYLVRYFRISYFINPLTDGKGVEYQYTRTFVSI